MADLSIEPVPGNALSQAINLWNWNEESSGAGNTETG